MIRIPKPHILKKSLFGKAVPFSLDTQILDIIQTEYGIGISICEVASLRDLVHESSSFFISDKHHKYVLKIYGEAIQGNALIYEHAILKHLSNHHLPVAPPLATQKGETYVDGNKERYAIYPFLSGYMFRDYFMTFKSRMNYVAQSAAFLGKMHACTEQVLLPGERKWPGYTYRLEELQASCKSLALKNAPLADEIKKMVDLWYRLAENTPVYGKLSQCIVHEDFGPYNLIFRKGKLSGAIDFMDAHQDCRIKDVVFSLMMFSRTREYPFHRDLVRVFLAEYQKEVRLTDIELEVMSDVFCLKRLNELPEFVNATIYAEEQQSKYESMLWDFINEIKWHQENKNTLTQLVREYV